MANKIDTPHPEYAGLQAKRDVFAAVKGGTDAMREAGTKYLPKYPAEADGDYRARLNAATIDGIVSGGVDTLCGAVFHGDIDTDGVNPEIQPLLEDIDNQGTHFNIFARNAFEARFDGSAVILVDTPASGMPVSSLGAQQANGIRPYWRLYFAKDVINWRYRKNPVNGRRELELIVFHESVEEVDPNDYLSVKNADYYRVLKLEMTGTVTWQLWRKREGVTADQAEFDLVGEGSMPGPNIRAAVVGDLHDEPPLLVEARLEIKAYQKESSFDQIEYLSVPTFYTKGYDGEEALKLGASTHIKLPADPAAEAGYVQLDAAGHESLKGTIAGIKDYIKARLNELTTQSAQMPVGGDDKTATQAVIEDRDKQARLILWAEQFKDALELALGFTAELLGKKREEGGEIVLNTKWEMARQAREQMAAQAQAAGADNGNNA